MDQPHMPTLGTLMHMDELREAAEGKTGMARIKAMLRYLNFTYCWTPGLREKWDKVNRHLWRFAAMYEGGDCFLAEFPGSYPHQRLWPNKAYAKVEGIKKNRGGTVTLPGWRAA